MPPPSGEHAAVEPERLEFRCHGRLPTLARFSRRERSPGMCGAAGEARCLVQKPHEQNMLPDSADSAPPAPVFRQNRSDGCKGLKLLISANHLPIC